MAFKGFDLTGKVAAITGSTSGIGLEIARGLAQSGAKIVVSSNDKDDTLGAVDRLKAEGFDVKGVTCDITKLSDAEGFFESATSAFGKVDILSLQAAGPAPQGSTADVTTDDIDRLFSEVRNNVVLVRKFLPSMAERKYGSIILMSSISSLRANPVLGAYGAGKAALTSFIRSIAAEWGAHNIRANAIAPAMVRTGFSKALWNDPQTESRIAARAPLNRIAEPLDLAGLAILLASPAGEYITGQAILVDGGRTIL
ncbi:hypothetical protein AYM40_26750 [Paraburkholderia phytofirmans OLGA172]|uniref:Ketoreductase domain-containing protein n=2 Tax=Paraburkholderia phytofirmans TaxID=261302 RepID=A0A160FS74_9BURK|nr:hypothetical protein AYM40_26750 [Paraburkholderia phytofirmans OLGA172]